MCGRSAQRTSDVACDFVTVSYLYSAARVKLAIVVLHKDVI